MFSFLLKRPESYEWDGYVKKNAIFVLLLSTVVYYLVLHQLYDLYVPFFSQLAINSVGIWLSYQLRKSTAGKVIAVLSLAYFLYNSSDTFIGMLDFIDGTDGNRFSVWPLALIVNTVFIVYGMIRICILLLNDYGQGVNNPVVSTATINVSKYESIAKLKLLYDNGALSEEEYKAEKTKLLENKKE
jgi:uncharacterized membrane protein